MAATFGFAWRWRRVLTAITPLDLVVVRNSDGGGVLIGQLVDCLSDSDWQAEQDEHCPLVLYGAAAETGLLLGAEAAPVWIGAGYRVGEQRSAAYGALGLLFGFRGTRHVQATLRAGHRYTQATVGIVLGI